MSTISTDVINVPPDLIPSPNSLIFKQNKANMTQSSDNNSFLQPTNATYE